MSRGMFSISLPTPSEILADISDWIKTQGLWWATSVTAHAVVLSTILLLMGTVAAPLIDDEGAPKFESVKTEIPDPKPVENFEVGDTPIEPTELTTDTLSLTDAPQIAQDEQINTTEADPFEEAGGGMVADAAVSFGGLGGFDVKAVGPGAKVTGKGGVGSAIGTGNDVGSGGAGSGFGGRGSGVRKAMLGAYGGTKGSERAVAAALNWLARHQNPNGSWSLAEYSRMCKDGSCAAKGGNSDTAATALALLPFLAAGQTHMTKGPYKNTIHGGLEWLISQQKNDGDLRSGGGTMYAHGLSTICLSEAFGLSRDKRIREAAQRAILFICAAQDPTGGGWRYEPREPGDTSVVGWQVMGLKSGMMAGLSVPSPVLEGAAKFLIAVGDGKGGFGYADKGRGVTTSAVGLLCCQYLGATKDSDVIKGGIKLLMSNLPNEHKNNAYYYYYGTQVMHNLPGADWDTWNRIMRKQLIESQIKQGCAEGSWDPAKQSHGDNGGRIMVTSLNCLTLEVYYRYLPLYQLDGKKPAAKK
jgi:hypothetical protein